MKRFIRLLLLRALALAARPWLRRPPTTITRVLYIKPDHLGDLLLATPVLAAIRASLPGAHITALLGPWAAIILAHNPDVDTLLTCPFPGFERLAPAGARLARLLRPYVLLFHYAGLLRRASYDAAIVGRDDHWWGAALAMLAGIPLRVGVAVPECQPFLSAALAWDRREHVTAQGLGMVALLAAAGGAAMARTADAFNARFDPTLEDAAWAADWLHAHGIVPGRLAIIHPGTAGPDKLWLAKRWAATADGLSAAGAQLMLTGGPGEQKLVAEVAEAMQTEAIQLAGATSVGQLAALLGRAALVLGVDSGPLHLAAAQGTPSLHLYGPGDPERFGPWGDPARHVVIREALWCSPCGVFSACPRGLARPECMERIDAARVLAAANHLRETQPPA